MTLNTSRASVGPSPTRRTPVAAATQLGRSRTPVTRGLGTYGLCHAIAICEGDRFRPHPGPRARGWGREVIALWPGERKEHGALALIGSAVRRRTRRQQRREFYVFPGPP